LLADSRASIARAGGDADAAARPSVDDGYAGGALSLPRDRIMNPRHAHTVMLMLMLSHVEGVQGRLLAIWLGGWWSVSTRIDASPLLPSDLLAARAGGRERVIMGGGQRLFHHCSG
jgi:hypothetical protein